ncbi:MAG: single-stranded DNA-binding protein [Eubacteriales bacterium]|nr:single-stranded DNA-binding protein [Eubacteriales bacterium]
MAKHNQVFLYGVIKKRPMITIDTEAERRSAQCLVTVVRGKRKVEDVYDGTRRRERLLVMTDVPKIVDEMNTWQENDTVEIKGLFVGRPAPKGTHCPKCNQISSVPGGIMFVYPVYAKMQNHNESFEEAMKALQEEQSEFSNLAYMVGTVCTEPKSVRTKQGLFVTRYQVAIGRKLRIRTDPPEINTDFPMIKTYGEQAANDKKRLKKGSVILIDGFLSAHEAKGRNNFCEHCGEALEWNDYVMDIVPYDIEYLQETIEQEEEGVEDGLD